MESEHIGTTAVGRELHAPSAAPHRTTTILSSTWARRDSAVRRLLAIADVVGLVTAITLVCIFFPQTAPWTDLLLATLLTIPVWILLFKLYGLYDRDLKRINHSALDDIPWLFHALLVGILILWAYTKLIPIQQLTFVEAASLGALAMLLITACRSGARRIATRVLGPERMLMIGDGEPMLPLLRRLRSTTPSSSRSAW